MKQEKFTDTHISKLSQSLLQSNSLIYSILKVFTSNSGVTMKLMKCIKTNHYKYTSTQIDGAVEGSISEAQ